MAGESPDDVAKLIEDGIAAALAKRERDARAKKDPETMAELIERVSDLTVDKLLAKLAEGEPDDDDEGDPAGAGGAGGGGGDGAKPVAEHPFFSPLFGKRSA